MILPGKA